MERCSLHTTLEAHKLAIGYHSKGRRQFVVQENLRLQLKEGTLVCLMGSNGAGKSTLLRTLAGIQAPLSGEILVGGKQIHTLSQPERAKRISLVLTEPISAGNMTVLELATLGRYPHTGWGGGLGQQDKKLVEQALDDLEIPELANCALFELSDGQRQKALIARALAQDGPLMILDEPTAHLDLINRLHIMRLLQQLAIRRKKTIIVATHELDLALQFANRLWLLRKEKGGLTAGLPEDLVLNGAIEQAFSRPGYSFDASSGQFKADVSAGVIVGLSGEGTTFFWTRKALQRKGYSVVPANPGLQIAIKADSSGTQWIVTSAGLTKTARCIEELLENL